MVGSSIPLAEFAGIYQAYEMLEDCPSMVPRRPERYDVINAIIQLPKKDPQIITLLLVEERKDLHLFKPPVNIEHRKPRRLAGLPLQQPSPFPSFKRGSTNL